MNPHNQGSYCTKIQLFSVALMCVFISLLMNFTLNRYLSVNRQVAIVDITGLIHQFVRVESKLPHSATEHQAHIQAFSEILEGTLQTIAEKKNVILVPKEAIIAGGIDLTPEVSKRLEASNAL